MITLTSFRTRIAAALIGVGALIGAPAMAFDTEDAKTMTRSVVDEVLEYIDANISEAQKIDRFKDTMGRYADVPVIARFTLGVAWRSATQAQQQAYVEAFDDYIANKYGRQFDSFDGETIDVLSALDAGQRGIVVTTRVNRRGGAAPVEVEWQFSDRSGEPKLVDIIVEGISLLTTERQEIGAMLDRRGGSIDRLIADLPQAGA